MEDPKCDPPQESDEDEEQCKVIALRRFLQSHDPSYKDMDVSTLRRFLRAHDMDVVKGGKLLLNYLKWRREFTPHGCVVEDEIQYDIAHEKVSMQGFDKIGHPILVVFGGKHLQNLNPHGLDHFKRFVVYVLDKLCARIPTGQEKFVVIIDLKDWGYSKCDIQGYIAALSILQDYYPERLWKMFMVHVPRIFMAVWKVIYPFIDKRNKTKIIFVENRVLKSTLVEDIEESQLPDIYGGKQPLVPIHRC
ncbi:hypothetical protein Dimus_004330 [Dionaea muscipula]